MIALALWLLVQAARHLDAPVGLLALLVPPAVLWAPGLGWARRLDPLATGLQRGLDAAWIALLLTVPGFALVRALGAGPDLVLHLALGWGLAGELAARGVQAAPPTSPRRTWVAAAGVLLAVGAFVAWQAPALRRPLDAVWWLQGADEGPAEPVPWEPGAGWGVVEPVGWEEQRCARLEDPGQDGGVLRWGGAGRVRLLVRGPVGTTLEAAGRRAEVQRDPVEDPEEGPVPRYLDRGVAGLVLDLGPGDLEVRLAVPPEGPGQAELWVLPGVEGPWSVHAAGALRYVHYYQLLNIVENLRWAQELAVDRALTVNQPPLWSYALAVGVGLVQDDLPGAAAVFVWVLVLLGLSAVRLQELLAPRAPGPALLLPGLGAVLVGQLMLEPGSLTFPDPLYTAALVAGIAALQHGPSWRFAALGLCAGLLRYPGVVALVLVAAVQSAVDRRVPWALLRALALGTLGLGAGFGLLALAGGQLGEWLEILLFETGPEHYHGETRPAVLLARVPEFYGLWLGYTGGGLLAALPLAGRGAKVALGGALVYSLLLCTIDHFPTHYFLPLVVLGLVAVGANAAALRAAPARWGLPTLALLAGLLWLWRGVV